MKIRVPNLRNKHLLKFCRNVVLGSRPIYVKHLPLQNKPVKECFSIVSEHISENGGKPVYGWTILESKGLWLEAEFHVIWKKENGDLLDITPRESSFEKILFLPDPKKVYKGLQVNSIFYPLSKKPSIKKFIKLTKERFKAANKGDLVSIQSGIIDSPEVIEIDNKIEQVMQEIFNEHG